MALCLLFGVESASCNAQSASPLTLRECVTIAVDKNPQKKLAEVEEKMANAHARSVHTALLPRLSFSEAVTRGNDPVYVFGTRLRQQQFTQGDFALNALNRPTPVNDFTTRFAGSWTIFDSLHTEREIRRADLVAQSQRASAGRTDQEVIRSTMLASQDVLLLQRELEVASDDVAVADSLLELSVNRLAAGTAVDVDRLAAEANLAERQQAKIETAGNLEVAWVELESSMGVLISPGERSLKPLELKDLAAESLEDSLALALKSRPDRHSLALQQEAARTGVASAKSALGPVISSFGSWETDRPSFAGEGGNNWIAGAEVRLDILPAAKRDDLDMAKLALDKAAAASALADSRIRLEVTRAFYQLDAARQGLAVARSASQQTDEALRISKDRYEAGLSTMTDLLRVEDQQRRSQLNYRRAEARVSAAYLEFQFAKGTLSPDTAEDLQ